MRPGPVVFVGALAIALAAFVGVVALTQPSKLPVS